MNISEAKKQIKETVRAYMSKDDTGAYCIDVIHQRPLFLIGAPGIGNVRNIAANCTPVREAPFVATALSARPW